ncbi:MAG: hypothetical protein ACP6IS_02255 [Candidatus Asgardarchaeia archaeon]
MFNEMILLSLLIVDLLFWWVFIKAEDKKEYMGVFSMAIIFLIIFVLVFIRVYNIITW